MADDDIDFDHDDDGLPGLPMAFALVAATVITMPIWLPLAVAFAAGEEVCKRVKEHFR